MKDYLKPTLYLIGAWLTEIMNWASQDAKAPISTSITREIKTNSQGLVKILAEATEAVDCAARENDERNQLASYLKTVLGKYTVLPLGHYASNRLKPLYALLDVFALFELGGIAMINAHLDQLLKQLKRLDLQEERKNQLRDELIRLANNLLFDAIYLFPHAAQGVEVIIDPSHLMPSETFAKTYGRQAGKGRECLENYRDLHSEERCQEALKRFVLPLPYGFTTGTHGSGERSAASASREEVLFTTLHARGKPPTIHPALAIVLARPLFSYDYTSLLMEELVSVRLVEKAAYSPLFSEGYHDNTKPREFKPRGNPVVRYLHFRNFAHCGSYRQRKQFPGISDQDWHILQEHLVEPSYKSGLWEEKYRPVIKDLLLLGFVAKISECGGSADTVTLFEFNYLKLPYDDSHVAAAKLFLNFDRLPAKKKNYYAGEAVIERLVVIPVKDRDF